MNRGEYPDRSDPTLAALRRLAPAKLAVTCVDGEVKTVAMPKAGNRWVRISQVLDALDWVRIEAQDKDGNTLGVIEEPEDDREDTTAVSEADDFERLAKVIAGVVKDTQAQTAKMFEAQMKGTADLVQSLVDANRALVESYQMAMKVQATATAVESASGNSEMLQMFAAVAPHLLKPAAPGGGK